MAPQWTPDEDRALLLALVQVMAPNGPSKHQFDGAREILKDRWTLSAITQHYNKKLRLLAPSTMGVAGAGSTPATPVKSATKRKAPASKAAAGSASASPGSAAAKGRGRKKATAKAVSEEPAEEAGDDEEGREDDEEGREDDEVEKQSPAKKAKVEQTTEEE